MTNISSAKGTLTIQAKNAQVLNAFVSLFRHTMERYAYPTHLQDCHPLSHSGVDDCLEDILNNPSLTIALDKAEVTFDFTGTGRWVYQNNVEDFWSWMTWHIEDDQSDCVSDLLALKETVEANWLILTYDFVDEESGCSCLYEATMEVTKPSDLPLNAYYRTTTTKEEHYDYNEENLDMLGFNAFDDVVVTPVAIH